jgi:hypothetical protein
MGVEEASQSMIVKFLTIIGLERNQGKLKLSTDVSMKG